MDRNLGLHILSHSAHIGVHGEPFGSYFGSVCAPIGVHRGSFGSHLRPIQHPSGGRGAHSDRNCVRFSTHRGVRKPVFDVQKKMTHNKTLVFWGFDVPKIGTATIRAMRQHGLRSAEISAKSRQQKNSKHMLGLPTCPVLLGFYAATHAAGARMELKRAE